jgi:thioredoxin reductase
MIEFKQLLTGPTYAKKLAKMANDLKIQIKLNSTLTNIDDEILTFSTPKGVVQYKAKKTIFALGARELPRSTRLISGIRSPNILTTGALQRFIYLNKQIPFKKAVIIGSDIVGFSALMSAKNAGIEVEAIIETKKNIDTYSIVKFATEIFLQKEVLTDVKILNIEGSSGIVKGITIELNGIKRTIECDGIIFSGEFTPESAILQESFNTFNYINNSAFVTNNFQTNNKNFFLVGNIIRGALAAFKCFKEGKKVAYAVDKSLKNNNEIQTINLTVSSNIKWYQPSIIDIDSPSDILTTLRVKNKASGILKVIVNDKEISTSKVTLYPFVSFDVNLVDFTFHKNDKVHIDFAEF